MHQILTTQRIQKIAIGGMDKVCQYCHALKFRMKQPACAAHQEKLCCHLYRRSLYYPFLLAIQMIPNYFLPDKVPLGEHAGRFNAPTVDEVAVIMVGDPVDKRSIKITICETTLSVRFRIYTRSYDALQYPLIFWQGQDEYHLNIKQSKANACGSFDLIRQNYDRKEYIHLRDAVAGSIDGNLNPNDIGNAFILPSSYIGSPRNMQEYMQDAMTYVRHYGRRIYLLHSHVIRIGKRYKLYYCQDNKPFIVMI
ncbi:helitron_like_N domain-containing protein [Trichonephila clavipes]|nr:helitron_like_N domain-containing protein [Trichonephila clavipes]